MNNIKVCIFDLDGTLTDTIRAIAHFGNLALEAVGLDKISVEDYKKYVGDGRDKLIHRMLAHYGMDTQELFIKARDVYDAGYENDYLYDTNAYSGIKELIAALKSRGIRVAVCTNKPDNVAHFVVETIFGADCFDMIAGVIDGMPTKPDPYNALKIADTLGVTSGECIFLGDTNIDISTAKNAKMTAVGVLWGFRSQTELIQAGADYIIDAPHKLLQLI